MAYSTDFIDADRALNYGLVSNVVDAGELDAEVDRFCGLLTSPRPAIPRFKRIPPQCSAHGRARCH